MLICLYIRYSVQLKQSVKSGINPKNPASFYQLPCCLESRNTDTCGKKVGTAVKQPIKFLFVLTATKCCCQTCRRR